MEKFNFNCPQCGQSVESDDSFRGQVVECPHCEKGIVVPRVSATTGPKAGLRPVRHENLSSSQPLPSRNVTLHPANVPKRNGMPNGPAVPESVGGMQHRNVEYIKDAFSREVKSIKGTANVLLLREVILFICIVFVIAGAVGGIWYSYRKRAQAEQMAWQREQERRRLDEEERQRLEEARKKAQEEERLARAREQAEEEAARKKALELAKAEQERRRRYEALSGDFKKAPFDYWKNAPASLRPGNVKQEKTYRCLFPDSVDKVAFYSVSVRPKEPMSVKRLSAENDPADVTTEEFGKLCTQNPYLMLVEGKVYFCPAMKWRKHHVPTDTEELNPSREEFGALYDTMQEMGIRPSTFRYEVLLQSSDDATPMSVGQVGFGDSLSRDAFRRLIRTRLEEEARYRAEEYERYKRARAAGGKTRSGQSAADTHTRAPLSRWFYRNEFYGYDDYSRGNTARVNLPGRTIYRNTNRRVYGPTQHQINQQIAWENRQRAQDEARHKREEAKARRQAEADARFAEKNTVKDEDIDEVLNKCSVTFRAVQ